MSGSAVPAAAGSDWLDRDRQALQPAQRVVVEALHRSGDLDRCDLARQRRHHHLAFEARDQLPDAHMNAGAVADMPRGATRDVVAVRILPTAGVAVGGAEEHQHLLAFADGVSADLDLARGGAEESLHWTLVADGFFERVARQRRIAA